MLRSVWVEGAVLWHSVYIFATYEGFSAPAHRQQTGLRQLPSLLYISHITLSVFIHTERLNLMKFFCLYKNRQLICKEETELA